MSTALVGAAMLTMSSATAAPKPSLAEVQRKIEKLQHQAEQASEDYNETREQLKSVNVRLKAAKVRSARQMVELKKSQAKVGQLASETYRRGELSTLDLVLGDDPDMALAQAGYLPSLGQRQTAAMRRLKERADKLAATEAEIKAQQAKAEATKAKLKKTKATVKKRLAQADAQLNGLRASDRSALRQSQNARDSAGVPAGGGSAFCNGRSVNAATAAGRAAITFACAQLGDPYRWGEAGPGQWDCSGLTMKAFAAGGVSLPHSSKLQANYGTRISVSNMMAGDLIFFNSPISHVSIYLGNNMMVHAPHSGEVVKVASMYDTPSVVTRL